MDSDALGRASMPQTGLIAIAFPTAVRAVFVLIVLGSGALAVLSAVAHRAGRPNAPLWAPLGCAAFAVGAALMLRHLSMRLYLDDEGLTWERWGRRRRVLFAEMPALVRQERRGRWQLRTGAAAIPIYDHMPGSMSLFTLLRRRVDGFAATSELHLPARLCARIEQWAGLGVLVTGCLGVTPFACRDAPWAGALMLALVAAFVAVFGWIQATSFELTEEGLQVRHLLRSQMLRHVDLDEISLGELELNGLTIPVLNLRAGGAQVRIAQTDIAYPVLLLAEHLRALKAGRGRNENEGA